MRSKDILKDVVFEESFSSCCNKTVNLRIQNVGTDITLDLYVSYITINELSLLFPLASYNCRKL